MFAYQVASLALCPLSVASPPSPHHHHTSLKIVKHCQKWSQKKIVSKTHHHKISLKTVLCHKPCSTNSPFLNIYYWSLSIS